MLDVCPNLGYISGVEIFLNVKGMRGHETLGKKKGDF